MFEKAVLYYFSPTGGTKKVGQTFCEAAKETQLVDLAEKEFSDMKADPEALAVIASWRGAQYFEVPLVAFPGYAGSCGGEPAPDFRRRSAGGDAGRLREPRLRGCAPGAE